MLGRVRKPGRRGRGFGLVVATGGSESHEAVVEVEQPGVV